MNRKELEILKHRENIKKEKNTKILLVVLVLGGLLVIYFSFFSNNIITGQSVKDISSKSIEFTGILTIPELKLNDELNQVELTGNSRSVFFAGDTQFDLADSNEVSIILQNYDGNLNFNDKSITKLNGKASKVIFNGIPITPQNKETLDVSFNENFKYNTLKINNLFIDKLNYKTTGKISLNTEKTVINVNNEEVRLKNFQGSLEIINNEFILSGKLEKLDIEGKTSDLSIGI